ncbi:MAG: VWA domain-containing protein [Myxococcales bacterium FL481]|nr:MAG: VWA domain-containing protein [Myxococcales bacterium FL481]
MSALRTLLALIPLVGCVACSTVELQRINSAERKPNNVWVFFSVEQDGEPVPGLQADDFEIYEDDRLVSTFESGQVVQNPELAAVMYTMLLLDMSGSITESGESGALVDAAKLFTERVGKTQRVAVFAFDGSEKIYPVVPFTAAERPVEGGLEWLRTFRPRDPSTNLNGAVVQGLEQLDRALQKDKRPIKLGTLVVFTDGTDRAARVSRDDVLAALADPKYGEFDIFTIGVGAEIEQRSLAQIGRDGTELAQDRTRIEDAFGNVANKIEAQAKRFYLLSYCTPSRRGDHVVRIEANISGDSGRPSRGSLEYGFNADNFGPPPACDPNRKPSFRLDQNLDTPPDDLAASRKK